LLGPQAHYKEVRVSAAMMPALSIAKALKPTRIAPVSDAGRPLFECVYEKVEAGPEQAQANRI